MRNRSRRGRSAGADNVPAELVQTRGEATISVLLTICNKVWQTVEWPTPWTQSLIITLPKKGNLQLCQNYRYNQPHQPPEQSHAVKRKRSLLRNKLASDQHAAQQSRSSTSRYCARSTSQHQQDLYHVFIDFKKAFDRLWHAALWATMRHFNINANLIRMIENLYDKATSAVYLNNSIGDWFRSIVGVRQGCVLCPTLFNIFLEKIMTDALNDHEGTASIGGRNITNLRFADDIGRKGGGAR